MSKPSSYRVRVGNIRIVLMFPLGLQVYARMHKLSCIKPSDNQSGVFLIENWQLVQSTLRSLSILRDWLSSEMPLTFATKGNVSKSAIHIWYDHYEFLVMPFGLENTPLIFMDLMNKAFHGYLDIWVAECTNDTLFYSTSRVEYGRHLVSVLEVFRKRDSSPSSWDVSLGWGSVILGLRNERKWTRSQYVRKWTHSCSCA